MSIPRGAVLVGYDGSPDSDLALSWAEQVAADDQRPLHVLISEVDPTQVLEVTADWHVSKMARIQADARDRLQASPAPVTSIELVAVPPSPALIDASKQAAQVVLGARGHSRLSGVLLGSVSQHVARYAACPVVVVRQPQQPHANRLVVGVDGSGSSRDAVEFAFAEAARTGAALTAIHGWRPARDDDVFSHAAEEIAVGERILAESLAGMEERYPDIKVTREAIPVSPSRVLADASESASLVVVGSRGRGAFAGLLLGSVSQAVLHRARCPVAVVR